MPPEPQTFDSQAVKTPSLSQASFTSANADGRLPAIINSRSRSSSSLTGLPAFFDSDTPAEPTRPGPNLEPNPPPMYWQSTSILLAGKPEASVNWPATPDTLCVEGQTFIPVSLYSDTWPCGSRQQCVMQAMP